MKVSFISFFFVILAFSSIGSAVAKVLPQAKSAKPVAKRSAGVGISVSPRLRADRQALLVSFGNLQNARSVTYNLIYQTGENEEGAGGTLSSSGNSATRELLFGTCSKNVCRYHKNISNMRFEVTTELSSGKKTLKRYRIKI